jgi:hypothetical protein
MRTTLNFRETTLDRGRTLAQDRGLTLSQLMDQAATIGINQLSGPLEITPDPVTGWPTFDSGRPSTREDVAILEDDE